GGRGPHDGGRSGDGDGHRRGRAGLDRPRSARAVSRARDRGGLVSRACRPPGGAGGALSPMTLRRPTVILLAGALDLGAREPTTRWHPVAWLGRAFYWAERRVPGRTVADGAAAVTLVTVGAWTVACWLEALSRRLGWAGIVLEALALKPAFAVRQLIAATA